MGPGFNHWRFVRTIKYPFTSSISNQPNSGASLPLSNLSRETQLGFGTPCS